LSSTHILYHRYHFFDISNITSPRVVVQYKDFIISKTKMYSYSMIYNITYIIICKIVFSKCLNLYGRDDGYQNQCVPIKCAGLSASSIIITHTQSKLCSLNSPAIFTMVRNKTTSFCSPNRFTAFNLGNL